MSSFEELVSSAHRARFQGWDFSYLRGRYVQGKPGWDYAELVSSNLPGANSLLDIGTGGGELLSTLSPLPGLVCATEGFRPNTNVALATLRRFGVYVVETWCDDNRVTPQRGALPFRDRAFDLVVDRHESYMPWEIHRVLRRGGLFITQQVGDGNNAEIHTLFHSPPRRGRWNLEEAAGEHRGAGLRITASSASSTVSRFLDVGALVYYLDAIPWEVPSFSPTKFEKELRQVHGLILEGGAFEVTTKRFHIVAARD